MTIVKVLLAFVAGMIGFGFMLIHPIGPAILLLAITPFDGIFYNLFGWLGNLITYPPVLVLLLKNQPGVWGRIFFGSRIQGAATLFIVLLSVSHVVSANYYGFDMVVEYAKKLTLLVLLGVFTYSMRDLKNLELCVKTLAASMALFTALSMLDFYFGISLLPAAPDSEIGTGLVDKEFETYMVNEYRFKASSLPINRFSNWLLMPTILAIGWLASAKTFSSRTISLGVTALLVLGQGAILSRGGFIAFGAGLAVLMVTAFRFRIQTVLGFGTIALAIGFVGLQIASSLDVDDAFGARFSTEHVSAASVGRLDRVVAGFQVFATSPLVGVGDSHFTAVSQEFLAGKRGGKGAHNAYVQVLAESGMIGFIPFMVLLGFTFQRLLLRDRRVPDEIDYWRPYFFAAFVAQLVHNVVHDYQFERIFWITIAYAAALEHIAVASMRQRAANDPEQTEYVPEGLQAGPQAPVAWNP